MEVHLTDKQERRIVEAMRSGAYGTLDEFIDRALEALHEQDEWLMANCNEVDAKIRKGMDELDRGEGIADNDLGAHLKRLKTDRE